MNKQELISKYEDELKDVQLKFGANFKTKVYEELLEDLKQLDGPQKVEVPQLIADWIEKVGGSLFGLNYDSVPSEIYDWVYEEKGNLKKLYLACAIGYTVEKEKRYIVKMSVTKQPLFYNNMYEKIFFSLGDLATQFTRKQLEEIGLGWVFDCPGIEVEEVK